MDTIFDELAAAITAPRFNWKAAILDLAGQMLAGVAIGFGIAVGLAVAG